MGNNDEDNDDHGDGSGDAIKKVATITSVPFQAFDYAAATASVTTSQMNSVMNIDELDEGQRRPQQQQNGKRSKGYNPFVKLQTTVDTNGPSGSVNQKRGYNAPRSATFR
jgi:hypothetical protein